MESTSTHLGYYVHLHGSGHAQRARTIAQHCTLPVTFIGTGVSQHCWNGVANYQLLDIPTDTIESIPDLTINQNCQTHSFHYAPYYSAHHRARAVAIANWVQETNPTAVIVDVSAEIIQYLRFLGVPVIGVRQHGDRSDTPHVCGYSAAYKLLAPFPELLEAPDVPAWIRQKTIYTPGFSRYSGRSLSKASARAKLGIAASQKVVLVINGKGGEQHSLAQIAAAAVATPQWLWLVVGQVKANSLDAPFNVAVVGWCEDTYIYLKSADVAIASGGHNTVMEIGTAQIPFLCIPESRPFKEQQVKAQLLENLGLSLSAATFPDSQAIAIMLHKLSQLNVSKWEQIMKPNGALQTAKAIMSEVKALAAIQKSLK